MKSKILIVCAAVTLLTFSKRDFATDRNFAFTYESRTLQGGLKELEAYVTYKYGRDDYYSSIQNRLEFEIGLGKRLQTSFYLNLDANTSPVTSYIPAIGENGELIIISQSSLQTKFNLGFSNEWKYQLSDPVANKIGSALYGEFSISPDEFELEGKIILDKKMNNFVTALNISGELEWEAEQSDLQTEFERESIIELNYGLAYLFPKNFSLGFELRNRNIIAEGDWEHSAFYAGPTFSFKQESWWMTFCVQPQITDLIGNGLTLEDDEKLNARLLFSYSF